MDTITRQQFENAKPEIEKCELSVDEIGEFIDMYVARYNQTWIKGEITDFVKSKVLEYLGSIVE